WAAFNNLIVHYIIPIAFIIDWVLTEIKIRYQWSDLWYWIIYPIGYIVFLDVIELGIIVYAYIISILILSSLSLGSLYILINRRRMNDRDKYSQI
ncbi:hypothetical protein LCGC14_2744670, partial [marine sediment metagenome]